ncbi:MAG: hypothetical protein QOF98_213, partial [Streptomyces sp.]|nr:hypothetical protein [Streptomyces sp.]
RPRLAAALASYVLALLLLLAAARLTTGPTSLAVPLTLGLLLFAARLLSSHGHSRFVATALATTCAAAALTTLSPLHLPLSLTLALAAVALSVHAFRVLPRASAHRGPTRI